METVGTRGGPPHECAGVLGSAWLWRFGLGFPEPPNLATTLGGVVRNGSSLLFPPLAVGSLCSTPCVEVEDTPDGYGHAANN